MHEPVVIRVSPQGDSSTINNVRVALDGKIPLTAKLQVLAGDINNIVVVKGQTATLYSYKTFIPMNPTEQHYRVEIGLDNVVYLHPLTSGVTS